MASNQLQKVAYSLESLGLSEKEARVYVASLFFGASSVQEIAKQAEINRPTAYVILEQLEEKGLVSESNEAKKTVYIPEPPEALGYWLEKQEKEIEEKKKEFKKMVSGLKEAHRESVPKAPQIRFYKGVEGILSMHQESMRKAQSGTSIFGFTNVDEIKELFPKHFQEAPKDRIKKKISSRLFYWSKSIDIKNNKKELREAQKLISPPKADISLFEDRATLLSYAGKNSVGVVIESKEIVDALRQLFELAWKNNKDF